MKTISGFCLLILISLSLPISAQVDIQMLPVSAPVSAKGIQFIEGDWQDALAIAKKENKILFVDAYAQWCGPCKVMAATTFQEEEVGKFFNDNFINLKLDMETPNGRTFGVEYPVSAYPTLYFIRPDGEIIKKVVGGQKAPGLMQHAQAAIKGGVNIEELMSKYEGGDRSPEFMITYIAALNTVGRFDLKVANEYYDSQPEWTDDQRAMFLFESATEADSRLFELMVAEKERIIAKVGPTKFNEKVIIACNATVEKAIEYEMELLLDESVDKAEKILSANKEMFAFESRARYYNTFNEAEKYMNSAVEYAEYLQKHDFANLKNIVADMCVNYPTNEKVLLKANEIAEKFYEEDKGIDALKVYTHTLMLTKDAKKALKVVEKALKKSKVETETSELQELITVIQSKIEAEG